LGDAVGEYILFPHGVFLWPDSGLTQNFEQEESTAVPEGQVKRFNENKAFGFVVVVVSCAILVAPVPGIIGLEQTSTEAAGLKIENVSNTCELRKKKEFIKKKRLNAQEWVQRGLEYLGSKNYEDAKRAFSNAIEINEGFLQLFNRAAAMHIRYGNEKQANNYLEKIDELELNLGFAYCHRGVACRELGKYHEAIFDFDRAIKHDSNYSSAYLERGRIYQKLGDYRQAIDNYNVVVTRNPRDAMAYCERSSAYIGLEFFPLAIMDCDKAIELDPKYARAYVDRGKSYQRLGNLVKGIENFKIAAGLGSQEAQDWLTAKGISW
jgi:tetratricopeptide (TPR) repeat protein